MKRPALKIPKSWPVQDPKRYAPLDRLIPYPHNARTHPPEQVTLLGELFKKFGPDQPIVVDEDWIILKGHGRRLGAIDAGLSHFLFDQRFGLSDADKEAIRIGDNAVALLAGWDKELIKGQVTNLKAAGYDLKLLGFGEAQLVQFATVPGPPGQFQSYGADIPTDFCCPSCGFAWSGKPRPDTAPPPEPAPTSRRKKR